MRRLLLAMFTLSAACAVVVAGGAHGFARALVVEKRVAQKAKPASKSPAAKPAAKENLPRPQVKVIDEAGLKALLDESAKNNKRLLINFWATWCTPCREEFPDLVKLDAEFAEDAEFEFITVSLDDMTELEKSVPQFLAEMRASEIPAYLMDAKDPENVVALVDKTWQGGLPATFLFGRKGEVLFRHMGRVKPDEVRAAIRESSKTAASDK